MTVSDNHTPSPVAFAPSPPSFDMDDMQFAFAHEGNDKDKAAIGGPATMDVGSVKQEPVDLSPVLAPQAMLAAPPMLDAQPMLAASQQEALQHLLNSFVSYQAQYGLDVPAASPASTGIDPSLLTVPTGASGASTPSLSASLSPFTPATTESSVPPTVPDEDALVSINDIAPQGQSSRAGRAQSTVSTFSASGSVDDKIDKLVPLSSIFSAGRGKGGKKGGGMSSVVRGDDEMLDEDDSWRPSPEEYKKLSSKEKRQLRNKLSARAFRTRRKDYIGTLESHIKDRDTVIDAIRSELATSRTENQDLRRELEALKASTMSVLHPQSAEEEGQSPPLVKALATSVPAPSPARRTATPAVNTRKDLASFDTSRGFWGGGNDNMFGGGSTICHTALTPEFTLPPQPNLNPLLNGLEPQGPKPLSLTHSGDRDIDSQTFKEFAENTPFTMRSMDNYRIQLWSRLSREAAADKANIAPNMRPKFLVEPKQESTLAAVATVATAATEHVASRLASSFWSAFTTSSRLDADKLAAVVTGKARLAVVHDEKRQPSEDALAHAMSGLKVATGAERMREQHKTSPLMTMASYFKPPITARV